MKVGMLCAFLVAVGVPAAVHTLQVPFDRLALPDGRVMAAGTIRSYDDLRDTVVVVSDRELATVPLARLPEVLAKAVRANVPERIAEDLAAERAEAALKAREAEKKQVQRERAQAAEAKELSRQSRAANMADTKKRARQTSALVQRVEAKVKSHAISYFKTHSVVGKPGSSGYSQATVEITTTEPVTGWPGRFRTEGRATVEPILVGNAYAQDFEVLAEIDAKNVVRIIETRLIGPVN